MAQMPRGEPRSVPDPDGDLYDEMTRQERLKRQRLEDALASVSPLGVQPPLRFDRAPPNPFVKIGAQTYGGFDTGRANVLVPVDDPQVSQAELEARRRAVARVSFMEGSPLGGAAYGLATLANAPPGIRDGALLAGGLADTALLGASPRASTRTRATPPRDEPVETLPRPNVRDREPNELGQARSMSATLTASMLNTGTRANKRLRPPGWQGNGDTYNEARSHVLGRELGGLGKTLRNIVTMTHQGANTPQMRNFEGEVARRLRGGEVIEYFASPLYAAGILPPKGMLLAAYGSRGSATARLIQNPAGRPK